MISLLLKLRNSIFWITCWKLLVKSVIKMLVKILLSDHFYNLLTVILCLEPFFKSMMYVNIVLDVTHLMTVATNLKVMRVNLLIFLLDEDPLINISLWEGLLMRKIQKQLERDTLLFMQFPLIFFWSLSYGIFSYSWSQRGS